MTELKMRGFYFFLFLFLSDLYTYSSMGLEFTTLSQESHVPPTEPDRLLN